MLDGTTLVAVLVAHAALQSIEWSPPGSGDYLARFQRNKERLENIASKKHGRRQTEKNGSILIENYDLQIFWRIGSRLRCLLPPVLLHFAMTFGIVPNRQPERLQK